MEDNSEPSPTPETLVADLVDLLTLERTGDSEYRGRQQTDGIGRVFGGQVVAQALQAAQDSAPEGMEAHSLHAYFLRGGREGSSISYRAEADFTGRSFANRRVVASQASGDSDSAILNLTASFQKPETGLAHDEYIVPDAPGPEDLQPETEVRRRFLDASPDLSPSLRSIMLRPRPIEMRNCDVNHLRNAEPREPRAASWFRTVAALPDIATNPAIHRAVIAYASDYTLLGTSTLPHGVSWTSGDLKMASLDHAIWFHRPARADEWLLYCTDSPWSGSGRGFNRGQIFNRAGQLIASVAQEGMLRKSRG